MNQDKRVLGRRGARMLTVEETAIVSGSIGFHTNVCSIPLPPLTATGPGAGDGDACGNGDIDQ